MEKVIWMICGSYTASMAWFDLRKKEIPVIPGIICAAVVVLLQLLRRSFCLKMERTDFLDIFMITLIEFTSCLHQK